MKWIIEARDAAGRLNFTHPQPETVFGMGAIHGITEDDMAKTIYRLIPDVVLTGDSIATWPTVIDPRFIARPKTW